MAHEKHGHAVPLWGLFLALLALTGGEVLLYELWRHGAAQGEPFVPKYAIVLLILVLTFPKAAIVMIYFMHLKFEKQMIVALAVLPLLMTFIAVLPTLTDIVTLKEINYERHHVREQGVYKSAHDDAGHGHEAWNASEQH